MDLPDTSNSTSDTRLRILRAARQLFSAGGYHGTSMRSIATESGLALGGLYNHFASKRELFAAVLLAYHPYHEVIPALQAASGGTVEAAVRDAATRLLEAMRQRPDFINLMFIEIVEMRGEHMPQLFDTVMPPLLEAIDQLTASGGQLRPIPTPVLMRAFVGMFFSYVITEQMFSAEVRSFFPPETLDHFVDIFLHGVMAEEPGVGVR
jgi:AcrR family transcriptional regulator